MLRAQLCTWHLQLHARNAAIFSNAASTWALTLTSQYCFLCMFTLCILAWFHLFFFFWCNRERVLPLHSVKELHCFHVQSFVFLTNNSSVWVGSRRRRCHGLFPDITISFVQVFFFCLKNKEKTRESLTADKRNGTIFPERLV